MAMGRSRITGTRTRLELAWQKERDEQQRIIQETSTLARDLRQTLLEVITPLEENLKIFLKSKWPGSRVVSAANWQARRPEFDSS